MKPRELQAMLRTLKANGVAKFTDGSISVEFQATEAPPERVSNTEPDEPLELPDGLLDPVSRLRDINRKHSRVAQ